MKRVDDYRKNAQDCRALAGKMPAEARAHLLEFARHWDDLAEEREHYVANRAVTEEPDPTAGPRARPASSPGRDDG